MTLPSAAPCRIVSPVLRSEGTQSMDLSNSNDQSLLAYYESIRRQVAAANRLGGRHRLAGTRIRQYAEKLKDEIVRRRLTFTPIDWTSS